MKQYKKYKPRKCVISEVEMKYIYKRFKLQKTTTIGEPTINIGIFLVDTAIAKMKGSRETVKEGVKNLKT